MKKILFLGLLFCSVGLFSQNQGSIKGTVMDKAMNNEPLLMANIQIKGQDAVIQSNFHGNFEISDISAGTHTLVISYLGYETEEMNIEIVANEVTSIAAHLSPMKINVSDVIGMDAVATEEVDFSSSTEKSPRK